MEQSVKPQRIQSIDILRGLVMLLMLVDHVREHFYYHVSVSDPMIVDNTSPNLFFTRVSAHFCAPVFIFLAGLSAWLYTSKNGKKAGFSFLIKRGIFIILLEITVVNFLWFGTYHTIFLQVMWAIGISMISLAFLSQLPRIWIGVLGIAIVAGHNLLSPLQFTPDQWPYNIWTVLHDRGFLDLPIGIPVKASYPVLPWIGLILLGYFAGPIFSNQITSEKRMKTLNILGISSLILLLIIRGFNIYGETIDWSVQDSVVKTIMSFLNFTKYPPSLDFILLTIGVGLLLLSLFEKMNTKYLSFLKTYGSSPMFFYLFHLLILLIIYKICIAIFGLNKGEYFGVDSVAQIWLITFILAIVLYYPTKLFSDYKRKSTNPLIKYF